MKHAVVTGGAGFLGSHMCELLLAHGYRITCLDNLITGSRKNIASLEDTPNFNFVDHDISTPWDAKEKIDAIFHFASPASPIDYQKIPIETLKVGSLGTLHMVELAKKHNARILFTSTSEVYGDPEVHPQKEDYWGNVNPIGPRGCYDEAKRFSEAVMMAYHRMHSLETRLVRIFNTYGPRQRLDDGRVVPAFMTQALKGEPVTLFGSGTQTRSFCYVSDLLDGIYRLFKSDYPYPVNIGNPKEHTVKELGDVILKITGSQSRFVFKDLPTDDPKRRRPDITLAKEKLEWEPKVDLETGLEKSLPYFKSCL